MTLIPSLPGLFRKWKPALSSSSTRSEALLHLKDHFKIKPKRSSFSLDTQILLNFPPKKWFAPFARLPVKIFSFSPLESRAFQTIFSLNWLFLFFFLFFFSRIDFYLLYLKRLFVSLTPFLLSLFPFKTRAFPPCRKRRDFPFLLWIGFSKSARRTQWSVSLSSTFSRWLLCLPLLRECFFTIASPAPFPYCSSSDSSPSFLFSFHA